MPQAPFCVGADPHPRKPRHTLPAGSTDCHCHVFADPEKYLFVAERSYTPPLQPLENYLRMCDTVGTRVEERVSERPHIRIIGRTGLRTMIPARDLDPAVVASLQDTQQRLKARCVGSLTPAHAAQVIEHERRRRLHEARFELGDLCASTDV